MLNYRIRAAELDDLAVCLEIDASYVTTHVWQMEETFDQESLALEAVGAPNLPVRSRIAGKQAPPQPVSFRVDFRPSRLPRPLAVPPPQSQDQLLVTWKKTDWLLVAEAVAPTPINATAPAPANQPRQILGYTGLTVDSARHLAWISSGAVQIDWRRRGVGQALLKEARRWADRNCLHMLMVEVQPKNFPAISFLQSNNFFFCGYNTALYPDQEIALFFALKLNNRRFQSL